MNDTFSDVLDWVREYGYRKNMKVTEVACSESEFMGELRITVVLKDPNHKWPSATEAQQCKS